MSAIEIKQDCVVTFAYVLSDNEGKELERAGADDPTAYLHGHFNILLALEAALEGNEAGAEVAVDLPAVKAYGIRNEKLVTRIPLKSLRATKKGKVAKGSHVQFQTSDGLVAQRI